MRHSDIINLWPSLGDFAGDIGVEYGTAKAMRRRSSIPPTYWSAVISAAKNRGIPGLDLQTIFAGIQPAGRVEAAE